MFRNRTTTQKPNEELISKFRKSFPNVISAGSVNPVDVEAGMHGRPEHDDIKHNDTTPKGLQDVRFTPSVMDPNSYQFMDFANQPPGYYTPTTGGMATMYHHQAGDLHTPMPYNLATPISIPHTLSSSLTVDPNADINLDYQNMHNQFMPQQFQNMDSFTEQTGFSPNSYMPHDSRYDPMDRSEESSMDQMGMSSAQQMNMVMPNVGFSEEMDMSAETHGEKFRYGVSLRAPTAMIKQSDEIPVTYLNKGQAYSLSVVDTTPQPPISQPCKYRTYIRVSFEDEQQRSKPSTCWQLWKEGRGSNEAYQRGGKLLAVEYVDPNQSGEESQRNPQIELEHASFDGFCVTWTSNPATGNADCALSVRFNFLSTDFSHSKGVKGIPVRLCAKTEVLTPNDAVTGLPTSEVSYCKVKLFRDHGAERKLSNDIAHVKKNMEKLKQQIAQMELGGGNIGKRKRSNVSVATKVSDNRPVKLSKHKRTWSIDSQEGAGKLSPEDDLHYRYSMLQDMFTSTRPISILNLRGDDHDDPDLYPVLLPGDIPEQKFEAVSRQNNGSSLHSTGGVNMLSPSNSSVSLNSPRRKAERPLPNHASGHNESMDWSNVNMQPSTLSQPVKVKKNTTTGYIEAIDIDPTYKPPLERPPKPIACFYVRFPSDQGDDYYRAVYLTERTVRDLMQKISEKYKIDTDRIVRILRINHNGLRVMVDDDVVQHLPEGQDMVAEFSDASKFEIPTPDIGTPTSAIEVNLKY